MDPLNENAIETMVIDLLQNQGYEYIHGPDIAPDSEESTDWKREGFEEILLSETLRSSLQRINPHIPEDDVEAAIKLVERIGSPELIVNNETFHRMLTEGINVTVKKVEG